MMLLSANAEAQISVSTLSAFGGGDVWLANGESTHLVNDDNARGLAYGNGPVYLVSRTGGNFIRILDPLTGGDLGALRGRGISGGTFPSNTIGLAGDGVIYENNLTSQSATSPFKVCSWAAEGSTPVVASQRVQLDTPTIMGA